MRRRALVTVCLVTAVLWSGASSSVADGHRALSASDFVDSVGVNIHSSYTDTAYARLDRVLSALELLHVRHIRDGLLPPSVDTGARAWQLFYYHQLAADGIRADLGMGSPRDGESTIDGLIGALGYLPPGFVESLEGPNEYDLSGDPDWVRHLRSYQQRLFEAVRATPSLRDIPVIGPSFGNIRNSLLAGNIGKWSDAGNIHPYPGGLPPPAGLASDLEIARDDWASSRVVATESGYHTALHDPWAQPPVSERAAAAYVPRLFLDGFKRGIARTYAYELVDEWPDPLGSNGEAHFGLFRNDFTPKPAAIALGHLLSIVDNPSPPRGRMRLSYKLKGDLANVQRLLLKRGDGSFALVLWQNVGVWDRDTRTDLRPRHRRLRIRLASRSRITTVRLLASRRSTAVRKAAAKIVIPADDTVVLLIKAAAGSGRGR